MDGATHAPAELALVAAIAGYHVVDHRRIPERLHPPLHVAVTAVVLAAGRRLGLSWDELGLGREHVRRGTRTGARHASVPVVGLLAASSLPLVEEALSDPRVAGLSRAELGRRVLVDIPFGTALYEEVVFRGVLLGLLRRHGGDRFAVLGSSLLFGGWHVLPALADRQHNPAAVDRPAALTVTATVAATTVAGALLARLRLRSGSLLAPIVAHAGINAAGVVAAHLVDRRRAGRPAPPASTTDPRD